MNMNKSNMNTNESSIEQVGVRRRWRGEELRWRGLGLGHGAERKRDGAPASATVASREAMASSRTTHQRTKKVARRCSSFGGGGVEGGIEGGSPVYEDGGAVVLLLR
jgi:hypothetical protein